MLLTCPSCGTRYLVDPTSLGAQGRTVRCGRCSHSWFQAQAGELPRRAPVAEPTAQGEIIPPARNLPAIRRPPRHAGALITWILALLLAATIVAGGYFGRERIVALWPPAVHIYESIAELTGLSLGEAGSGLTIRDVSTRRDQRSGQPVLVIEGIILNTGKSAQATPRLRIVLLDQNRAELVESIVTPPQPKLLAGERVPFKTHIVDPPSTAADLMIEFATD